MKRYRVFSFDFDSRARLLSDPIHDEWEEDVKEGHRRSRNHLVQELISDYGEREADFKIENFIDLGPKPFSIVAFHNKFSQQLRNAFVLGAYYPALTAACALGERILNHLILLLREDFRSTPEYKRVYRRGSFDNWELAISTLVSWGVLLSEVETAFRDLARIRNRSIHFIPEVDHDDRQLALQAIRMLNIVLERQFGAFGNQPWFLCEVPGEMYLKKQAESDPFIRAVYLPNCHLVGPLHTIELVGSNFVIQDEHDYPDYNITDDEFRRLRVNRPRP